MKICICCSLRFPDDAQKVASELRKLGHEVLLPNGIENRAVEQPDYDAVAAKHDDGYDSMRAHFEKIRESDAVLALNFTKNGIENYIGAGVFIEMVYGYSLRLPIYTLNPLPDIKYINDELLAISPIVLNGDLSKLAIKHTK